MSTPIATKDGVQRELLALENMVRLAAFATESRRILEGISAINRNFPEVSARIHQQVDCASNWAAHEDTSADVLSYVADRLASLALGE